MSDGLESLLRQYGKYFQTLASGKIECTINGHCLPARYDAVSSFINGKKFQRLQKMQEGDAGSAIAANSTFLSRSTNFPTMVYCAVTGQLLEASAGAIQRHMGGKKFQGCHEQYTAGLRQLKPEPSLSEFGVKVAPVGTAGATEEDGSQDLPEEGDVIGGDCGTARDVDMDDADEAGDDDREGSGEESDEMAVGPSKALEPKVVRGKQLHRVSHGNGKASDGDAKANGVGQAQKGASREHTERTAAAPTRNRRRNVTKPAKSKRARVLS